MKSFFAFPLIAAVLIGCGPVVSSNTVARYMAGAEIQAEDEAQRAEVKRALQDMLVLPVAELRARRYKGYSEAAGSRSLIELLQGHVVPTTPQTLDAEIFFADLKKPEGQAAISALLEQYKTTTIN